MNKIKFIYTMMKVFKILAFFGALFAIIFFLLLPNGQQIETGGPYWNVEEPELIEGINETLPKHEGVRFTDIRTSIEISLNSSFKVLLIFFIFCVSAYFIFLLHIAQRVVQEVGEGHSFTWENIKRIKTIGILIAFSMVGEKILVTAGNWWFSNIYQFEGMKIITETHLGWHIVIVGAIIFALGVAFEQGLSLKEEQDLTI